MLEDLDPSTIQDAGAREVIVRLLNLIETLAAENRALREEVQRLRDENNRLKGEHGKPTIKPNTPKPSSADHSSEQERRTPKPWQKGSKAEQIPVHRTEVLRLDRNQLPADAEFKGYDDVVVQDIVCRADNVCFRKEQYYSASLGKTYRAPLPAGYAGEFGPGLKALGIVLTFAGNMTEPKLLAVFHNIGVRISAGELSNLLIHDGAGFHAEKAAIVAAGLSSSPWQHIDDTGTRVNGQNQHCQIVCNPLDTGYWTTAAKDRLTILDVLQDQTVRTFLVNDEAVAILATLGVSATVRQQVARLVPAGPLDEAAFAALLATQVSGLGPQQRRWVQEAAAVAAYHAQTAVPVVRTLVCDDAPQFKGVTEDVALCWVHDGRHYKKLMPVVAAHRAQLTAFLTAYWAYYRELLAYREQPRPEERARLAARFDALFSTVTGYDELDGRIARTKAKEAGLLRVLDHPELPLHNNPAELGARRRVRKRDVSFGPRTPAGARAWDTFQTLAATADKLGVSFYAYVHDRVSQTNRLPSLASLITERAAARNLGASWAPMS